MAPAALGSPATTANGITLKCTNHWSRRTARNGLNVSRLFTVSPPAATPLIATIAPITTSAAAIITWGQPAESA
jgi:hypothetical protein